MVLRQGELVALGPHRLGEGNEGAEQPLYVLGDLVGRGAVKGVVGAAGAIGEASGADAVQSLHGGKEQYLWQIDNYAYFAVVTSSPGGLACSTLRG